MNKLIDLSHSVEEGLVTYPGLPSPVIGDFISREGSCSSYAAGTSFHIGRIEMVANTGTYIDSPFHRYADGRDLAELPLESVADLTGIVFRAEPGRAIGLELFDKADLSEKAVLIHTGWAKHWRSQQYFHGHPFLTKVAAQGLAERGAALVGIDSLNIDDTRDGTRPAHSLLLGANIPIVEHLCNLEKLPPGGFKFHAVPVKVRRFGTFPVRAYAVVDTANVQAA